MMMAMLLGTASLWARPALKGTVSVKQPDGTSVSIRLIGDEYMHYNTTADGYTVVKNDAGFYVYAQKSNGQLTATKMVAHDADKRANEELQFLSGVQKHIAPEMAPAMQQMRSQNRARRAQALAQRKAQYDYSKFKGLILLVEYSDCKFIYTDYKDIMEGMVNERNYTGTNKTNVKRNEGQNRSFIENDAICVGSMRDYYYDSSNGQLDPTFNIVGPVTVNRTQKYVKGNANAYQLMIDACTAADSKVNFKDYDTDGDGIVDMVYFIFAGLPSYIQGNNEDYLWPHQSDMRGGRNQNNWVKKDGVYLGRYACSTELFGYEPYNWSVLEGIGTMCHEFSHVLGLPDFYDADYEGSGGQSDDPGAWSVMANGADLGLGRSPCSYSIYERYMLGFTTPEVISEPGSFSLASHSESNKGYRLNSTVNKEYFILENRQKTKWDAQLSGHGMLIFRVDSTSAYPWTYNTVNNNPNHMYYEMVRAGGGVKQKASDGNYYMYADGSDPFPGTKRVTEISNTTTPANLKTWAGKLTLLGLRNITESDGNITFEAFDVNILTEIIMQQSATIGIGTTLQLIAELVPETAKNAVTWKSDNEQVATVSGTGMVTGIAEGTANITVTSDNGVSATCVVTVKNMPIAENIAAFCQMEEGSEALLQFDTNKNPGQVLYVKGSDIYVRDASGSIVLSGTKINAAANNVITGVIYGKLAFKNRMPQFTAVEGTTNSDGLNIAEGTAAEPREVHVSQLNEQLYADMVIVKKAQLTSNNGIWVTFGDKRARIYNTLGAPNIKVPKDLTKRYDITAIFGTNVLNGEVIDELYLLKTPVSVIYMAPTAISLQETLRIDAGRTYRLEATVTPANADAMLSWTSSNEQVATVDKNGTITTIADGQATITVTDLESGLKAECQVTVGDRLTVANIADFKALSDNSEANLALTNVQVLYNHQNTLYVRDATGTMMLSGTGLNAKNNQLLNGMIFGVRTADNLMPMLAGVSGVTTADGVIVTDGGEAAPRNTTLAALTDNDLCDYVVVKSVQLEKNGGIFAVDGNMTARLYNTFGLNGIKVPTNYEGKYFDITAIFGTTLLNGEVVYELKLLKSPVEVEAPSGIQHVKTIQDKAEYYDMSGRLLKSEPSHGVYLMKKGGVMVKKTK